MKHDARGRGSKFLLLLFVGAVYLLGWTAAAQAAPERTSPWWLPLPENVSTFGHKVDGLFWMIFYVTGFFFILTEVALIWFVFRYRRRQGEKATFIHGNRMAEIIWTVIPGVILFSMAVYSAGPWSEIKRQIPPEDQALVIEVMARQFEWHARYPGPDGKFGAVKLELAGAENPFGRDEDDPAGKDDIVTINDLHIPVGRKILIKLGSRDVIHSFFLPHMRVKQDALPGTTIPVWFEATRSGEYELACAELCGLGHYKMRGLLTVHSKEEFESWLKEQAGALPSRPVAAREQ